YIKHNIMVILNTMVTINITVTLNNSNNKYGIVGPEVQAVLPEQQGRQGMLGMLDINGMKKQIKKFSWEQGDFLFWE
ncbi:hypothetical protein, partial [Bacillus cereus]|uniref:hypothetical protein n=1 Tax=Bacillus cereus TaxID=1396 RepID=UPI001596E926